MKTKAFSHERQDGSDDWLTPPYILDALGEFDLDPCACGDVKTPRCQRYYNKEMDGLSRVWTGRVWLNPPYGKGIGDWLERLARHNNGIALTFARTDTKWFHRYVWNRAGAVFFFAGRLKFLRPDGTTGENTAGGPSCLIAYDNGLPPVNRHWLLNLNKTIKGNCILL